MNQEIEQILNTQDNSDLLYSLEKYLGKIEDGMDSWLTKFDWKKEVLLEKNKKTTTEDTCCLDCPYNKAHTKIKNANFDKHVERCYLKSLNFSKQDIAEFYRQPNVQSARQFTLSNSQDMIKISYDTHDEMKKATDLVTLTNKHYFTNLSCKERLSLHEYATQKICESDSQFVKQPFLDLNNLNLGTETTLKDKDGSINVRDLKRRPRSYKSGKSSSYTEKIKELIDYQMNLIKEFNEQEAESSRRVAKSKRARSREEVKRTRSRKESDGDESKRHRSRKTKKKSSKKSKKSKKSGRSESSI